eukprot:2915101-Pleurochrysis_carterae.AAC.1
MAEMANECKRKIEEMKDTECKTADDAGQKIAKMRQLLKAADEKNAQLVKGWDACESKFSGGGAKTRSGAH